MIKQEDIKNPYHPESAVYLAFSSLKNIYGSYDKATLIDVARDYDRSLGSNLVADVKGWFQ